MSNFYFRCDNCGRETNGITFINGMKFCAKCYQEIFGKDNKQNEIQQLKQQLEEKDKEIDKQRQIINTIQQNIRQYSKEDYEDKQQLYEDIEMLKQNQTQLAIQELEKVKNFICDYSEITGQAWNHTLRFLNNRIKELKGEKNDNRWS